MAKIDSYFTTPGIAVHPWLNEPDFKWNDKGLLHTKLILDGNIPAVQALKVKVEEQAAQAFADAVKDLTPAERKKWKLYTGIEEELDDESGEPTGNLIFNFKRNHTIKVDGEEIKHYVKIADSDGETIPREDAPRIFNGSTLTVGFSPRAIKVASTKTAGVRLDPFAVQIVKLAAGRGGRIFGKVASEPDDDGDNYVFKRKPAEAPKSDQTDDSGDGDSSDYA